MRILLFLVPTLLFGISKDLPLDSYVTKNAWERIELHDHYGIDVTLLGLVSKNSSGNGEFLDLLPLIDFLATNPEITNLFKTVLSPTSPVNRSNNKLIPTASFFN